MTKKVFRFLILFYILVVIMNIIPAFFEDKYVPSDIMERAVKAQFKLFDNISFQIQLIIVTTVLCFTILFAISSLLGMLFFWSKSRYLFALAATMKILLAFSSKWNVSSCFDSALGGLEMIFEGIIISLVFWGSAKPLFEKKKEKLEQLPINET